MLNEKVIPNLGILYVAAALRKDHEVQIVDLNGVPNSSQAL